MEKIKTLILTSLAIAFFGFVSALAADNSPAPSKDDIRAACAAVTEACLDACDKGSMTGPQYNACTNGCGGTYQTCIDSVASKKGGAKKGGVLTTEPALERAPVAADNSTTPAADIAAACEATQIACEEACNAAKFTDFQRQQCGSNCTSANDKCTGSASKRGNALQGVGDFSRTKKSP